MSIGYPDYSRTQAEAGNQLGSYTGQKQTDPTTGVMDAIGYAYLTIQVNDTGNVNHFSMIITWYSDNAGTNIINTSQFVPVPGSNVAYQVPAVSRYARVTASHQVALDTEVVSGVVFGSNVRTEGAITGPKANPFIFNQGSVAGGGTQFVNALYTYWGPAVFSWEISGVANCTVTIEYFDINTASFRILYWEFMNVSPIADARRVSIPPNPIRVGLYNNTGGALIMQGAVCLG